eukprot:Gb_31354 [translate_table: standard]
MDSDVWSGLPDDVLIQVLARLPKKSLFRFKSVCKKWRSIPTDPHFTNLHSRFSSSKSGFFFQVVPGPPSKNSFLFIDQTFEHSELSLDFLPDQVLVRASCHGLLCCDSIMDRGVYYICNPMTREWKLLPNRRKNPAKRYDPDEATLVGLAFYPSTQRCKVVFAGYYTRFGQRSRDILVTQIYDSQTDTWKRSSTTKSDIFSHINRNQVVFANGSLHWLTYSSVVLAFDLDKEVWRRIPGPLELVTGNDTRLYLLELEGCISMIQNSGDKMRIWVLQDYEEQKWVETNRIPMTSGSGIAPLLVPLSQTRELVFLASHKQILACHLKEKLWKEVYLWQNTVACPLWFLAHAFEQTLFFCRDKED